MSKAEKQAQEYFAGFKYGAEDIWQGIKMFPQGQSINIQNFLEKIINNLESSSFDDLGPIITLQEVPTHDEEILTHLNMYLEMANMSYPRPDIIAADVNNDETIPSEGKPEYIAEIQTAFKKECLDYFKNELQQYNTQLDIIKELANLEEGSSEYNKKLQDIINQDLAAGKIEEQKKGKKGARI